MTNLRNIKDRISSIKNTQKITRAMKMVAAAKVKKAENAVKQSRPFTLELYKMFMKVCGSLGNGCFGPVRAKNAIDNYPILLEERKVKTLALVVISSNKGLAGGYCTNIVRYTLNKIKEAKENGIKVELFLIGQKAYPALKNANKNNDYEIKEVYTGIIDDLNASSARIVAEDLAEEYVARKIDKIELITTRYINMVTYKVENWTLLPTVNLEAGQEITVKKFHNDEFDAEHNVNYEHNVHIDSIMEFMPSVQCILQKIVPMYITNVIYQAMLEAQASELSSRMTAMSAATNNADDMINTLTVQYNKVRQESITQELNEVISGSIQK